MRRALTFSILLLLIPAATAQNPPAIRPAGGAQEIDDAQLRKEINRVHEELSNMLKQQTDLLKTITPNAGIIPPLNGNKPAGGPYERLYGAGRTGLSLINLPAEFRNALKIDKDIGILVKDVFPETPAALAGYKIGDVLVEFNGSKVPNDLAAFMGAAAFIKNDVPVRGTVIRGDKRLEMGEMKLTDRRVIPLPVMKGDLVPTAVVPRNGVDRNGVQIISTGMSPFPREIQRFDGVKEVTSQRK